MERPSRVGRKPLAPLDTNQDIGRNSKRPTRTASSNRSVASTTESYADDSEFEFLTNPKVSTNIEKKSTSVISTVPRHVAGEKASNKAIVEWNSRSKTPKISNVSDSQDTPGTPYTTQLPQPLAPNKPKARDESRNLSGKANTVQENEQATNDIVGPMLTIGDPPAQQGDIKPMDRKSSKKKRRGRRKTKTEINNSIVPSGVPLETIFEDVKAEEDLSPSDVPSRKLHSEKEQASKMNEVHCNDQNPAENRLVCNSYLPEDMVIPQAKSSLTVAAKIAPIEPGKQENCDYRDTPTAPSKKCLEEVDITEDREGIDHDTDSDMDETADDDFMGLTLSPPPLTQEPYVGSPDGIDQPGTDIASGKEKGPHNKKPPLSSHLTMAYLTEGHPQPTISPNRTSTVATSTTLVSKPFLAKSPLPMVLPPRKSGAKYLLKQKSQVNAADYLEPTTPHQSYLDDKNSRDSRTSIQKDITESKVVVKQEIRTPFLASTELNTGPHLHGDKYQHVAHSEFVYETPILGAEKCETQTHQVVHDMHTCNIVNKENIAPIDSHDARKSTTAARQGGEELSQIGRNVHRPPLPEAHRKQAKGSIMTRTRKADDIRLPKYAAKDPKEQVSSSKTSNPVSQREPIDKQVWEAMMATPLPRKLPLELHVPTPGHLYDGDDISSIDGSVLTQDDFFLVEKNLASDSPVRRASAPELGGNGPTDDLAAASKGADRVDRGGTNKRAKVGRATDNASSFRSPCDTPYANESENNSPSRDDVQPTELQTPRQENTTPKDIVESDQRSAASGSRPSSKDPHASRLEPLEKDIRSGMLSPTNPLPKETKRVDLLSRRSESNSRSSSKVITNQMCKDVNSSGKLSSASRGSPRARGIKPRKWTAERAGSKYKAFGINSAPIFRLANRKYYKHPPLPPGWALAVSRSKDVPYYIHPNFGVTFYCPVPLPSSSGAVLGTTLLFQAETPASTKSMKRGEIASAQLATPTHFDLSSWERACSETSAEISQGTESCPRRMAHEEEQTVQKSDCHSAVNVNSSSSEDFNTCPNTTEPTAETLEASLITSLCANSGDVDNHSHRSATSFGGPQYSEECRETPLPSASCLSASGDDVNAISLKANKDSSDASRIVHVEQSEGFPATPAVLESHTLNPLYSEETTVSISSSCRHPDGIPIFIAVAQRKDVTEREKFTINLDAAPENASARPFDQSSHEAGSPTAGSGNGDEVSRTEPRSANHGFSSSSSDDSGNQSHDWMKSVSSQQSGTSMAFVDNPNPQHSRSPNVAERSVLSTPFESHYDKIWACRPESEDAHRPTNVSRSDMQETVGNSADTGSLKDMGPEDDEIEATEPWTCDSPISTDEVSVSPASGIPKRVVVHNDLEEDDMLSHMQGTPIQPIEKSKVSTRYIPTLLEDTSGSTITSAMRHNYRQEDEVSAAGRGSIASRSYGSVNSNLSRCSHRALFPKHPLCALQNLVSDSDDTPETNAARNVAINNRSTVKLVANKEDGNTINKGETIKTKKNSVRNHSPRKSDDVFYANSPTTNGSIEKDESSTKSINEKNSNRALLLGDDCGSERPVKKRRSINTSYVSDDNKVAYINASRTTSVHKRQQRSCHSKSRKKRRRIVLV